MSTSFFRALGRRTTVLMVCLGLAGVSLAAAGKHPVKLPKDRGQAVVQAAKDHLGDRYVWGASGPRAWDCSGLTSRLWRQIGGVKDIPRTSRQQQAWAIPLPAEQVRPGDLVFFGDPVTHVGIVERRRTTSAGTTVSMIDAAFSRSAVIERKVWRSGTVRYGRVPRPGMVRVQPWKPPPTPTPTAAGPAPVPAKAAALLRGYLGDRRINDVNLVRNAWHRAGGPVLPGSRDALARRGRVVALRDVRVGDLISYASPRPHVGLYVGNGFMIDASRLLGKVVKRKLWSHPSLRVLRLTP